MSYFLTKNLNTLYKQNYIKVHAEYLHPNYRLLIPESNVIYWPLHDLLKYDIIL